MSLRYCSHLFNFLQMSHNSFSPNSFIQPREAIWCIGCVPVCAKSFPLFDSATPLTIALQGPLSSRFSRQEYWSGLPFPPSGIKLTSLMSPALAGRFFTTSATWEAHTRLYMYDKIPCTHKKSKLLELINKFNKVTDYKVS